MPLEGHYAVISKLLLGGGEWDILNNIYFSEKNEFYAVFIIIIYLDVILLAFNLHYNALQLAFRTPLQAFVYYEQGDPYPNGNKKIPECCGGKLGVPQSDV